MRRGFLALEAVYLEYSRLLTMNAAAAIQMDPTMGHRASLLLRLTGRRISTAQRCVPCIDRSHKVEGGSMAVHEIPIRRYIRYRYICFLRLEMMRCDELKLLTLTASTLTHDCNTRLTGIIHQYKSSLLTCADTSCSAEYKVVLRRGWTTISQG